MPMHAEPGDNSGIRIDSGVSAFTGDPFITLKWGDQAGQLTPDECRAHASALLIAAEAAMADAALWRFLKADLKASDEQAGMVLQRMRRMRVDLGERQVDDDAAAI